MNHLNVYFHPDQLNHKPVYEWAFGEKLPHPETTHRAENILHALEKKNDRYKLITPNSVPLVQLKDIHDRRLLKLYQSAEKILGDTTINPSVFPKRNQTVADPTDVRHAGYFCFDSGTPLTSSTWMAATWSAACAFQAANIVGTGEVRESYALCRPPGHHASRDLFGGYCYFNNAAIAATHLKKNGKVVILDIDFHHGNGTQKLFYQDPDVLFISIHGDPKEFYPYFWGHASENGKGAGKDCNLNLPLPLGCDGQAYCQLLEKNVLPVIKKFNPSSLVISAGFDTYKLDPIGKFSLETNDYFDIGIILSQFKIPTVIVQEGGYCTDQLGTNVETFLNGFMEGRRPALLSTN